MGAMSPQEIGPETWALASGLFKAFAHDYLAANRVERWVGLFESRKAKHWGRIRPWDLWDEASRNPAAAYEELSCGARAFASVLKPPLRPTDRIFFYALGHSTPELATSPFAEVGLDHWPLEGVVLVHGRSEGFVLNHDGDLMLCRPVRA
jgi:hypothetical protein